MSVERVDVLMEAAVSHVVEAGRVGMVDRVGARTRSVLVFLVVTVTMAVEIWVRLQMPMSMSMSVSM